MWQIRLDSFGHLYTHPDEFRLVLREQFDMNPPDNEIPSPPACFSIGFVTRAKLAGVVCFLDDQRAYSMLWKKTHEGLLECPRCSKRFLNKKTLFQHIRRLKDGHADLKDLIDNQKFCSRCNLAFQDAEALKTHRAEYHRAAVKAEFNINPSNNTHPPRSPDREFVMRYHGKFAGVLRYLGDQNAYLISWRKTGEGRFKCPSCRECLLTKHILIQHIRKLKDGHADLKDLIDNRKFCNRCNLAFPDAEALDTHKAGLHGGAVAVRLDEFSHSASQATFLSGDVMTRRETSWKLESSSTKLSSGQLSNQDLAIGNSSFGPSATNAIIVPSVNNATPQPSVAQDSAHTFKERRLNAPSQASLRLPNESCFHMPSQNSTAYDSFTLPVDDPSVLPFNMPYQASALSGPPIDDPSLALFNGQPLNGPPIDDPSLALFNGQPLNGPPIDDPSLVLFDMPYHASALSGLPFDDPSQQSNIP